MAGYQGCLLALALTLAVLALHRGIGNPFAVFGLAAIAALAERGSVRLASSTEVSISVLPTVFAAAVFGPLAAMIVAIELLCRRLPIRSGSNEEPPASRAEAGPI